MCYVKFMDCADKTTTLETLKVSVNRAINEIQPEILEKVIKNCTDLKRFVMISHDGHMPEIIVKI